MQLDFVSDFACPWCAVGLAGLVQALQGLPLAERPTLRFVPFELNPDLGPDGVEAAGYLKRKYGLDDAQLQAARAHLHQRGEAVGVHFAVRAMVWNTFDAHRLALLAQQAGPAAALILQRELLGAYHERGLNPADPAVLRKAGQAAGLDAAEVESVIGSDRLAAEVRQAQAAVREQGVNAVPTLMAGGRILVQGAQPPEVLEGLLQRLGAPA